MSILTRYCQVLKRGCRCIEIDVWNGEVPITTDDSASVESASHISNLSNTFNKIREAAVEKVEDKYDSARHLLGGKPPSHHRSPSNLSAGSSRSFTKEDKELSEATDAISLGPPVKKSVSRKSSHSSLRPEPMVLHGRTLMNEITFRSVCQTIRETAFETNDLPLIVSLEVHADWEQQQIMVDIMNEEWEGLLVDEKDLCCDPNERLPALGDLKRKILIKVKKAKKAARVPLEPVATGAATLAAPKHDHGDSGASGSEDERASNSGKSNKSKKGICPALGQMGIYTHSAHFESFEQVEATKPPHVFSVGESKILELHESKREKLFEHNRHFFMRAYPAGIRIDSSNLDPSVFWRKGVQMVALNWQTWDEGMMLNEGMFAGEHGWVLKPPGYRSESGTSDQATAIEHKTLDFSITVFAGQHIPMSSQDDSGFKPYVKCELHVEMPEERKGQPIPGGGWAKEGEFKAHTKPRKGDNPDFGPEGETMEFKDIPNVVESLSFVR